MEWEKRDFLAKPKYWYQFDLSKPFNEILDLDKTFNEILAYGVWDKLSSVLASWANTNSTPIEWEE